MPVFVSEAFFWKERTLPAAIGAGEEMPHRGLCEASLRVFAPHCFPSEGKCCWAPSFRHGLWPSCNDFSISFGSLITNSHCSDVSKWWHNVLKVVSAAFPQIIFPCIPWSFPLPFFCCTWRHEPHATCRRTIK